MDNDNIISIPDPPSSPRIKHKRKKKKDNDNPFKDKPSTKKKKKSAQQRTKKKNRKNHSKSQNSAHDKKKNYHKKKKKKNGNEHKKKKYSKYRKKHERNEYRVGVVMVIPQSQHSWGWVHCKNDNMMYRLSFSQKTTSLQLDQKLLFIARQRKNGLGRIHNIEPLHEISLHTIHSEYLNHKNESIASNHTFVLNTSLNRNETNDTEFKSFIRVHYNTKFQNNLMRMIEKYLNGFINMNGGTIYIGINDEAIVKGIDFIDRNKFDIMQQMLPQKLNQWEPQSQTRNVIQSLKFEMKDVVNIENKEHCGYILPKFKVIEASISPIYDDVTKKQIICNASDGFVYCREGTSLAVYSDVAMTADHKCTKRPLNKNGYNYGFWEAVSKRMNTMDLIFDEGDDVVTAQSSSTSTGDDDDSLVYMESSEEDDDSDSADIDSDEDSEDSEHKKNLKYVRRPSEEMNENEDGKSYNAMFDYNGGSLPDELLFKRDDQIVVDDSKNNGLYLHGYKSNSPRDKGWFPSSYVDENK